MERSGALCVRGLFRLARVLSPRASIWPPALTRDARQELGSALVTRDVSVGWTEGRGLIRRARVRPRRANLRLRGLISTERDGSRLERACESRWLLILVYETRGRTPRLAQIGSLQPRQFSRSDLAASSHRARVMIVNRPSSRTTGYGHRGNKIESSVLRARI
jgi:hypothetical protein